MELYFNADSTLHISCMDVVCVTVTEFTVTSNFKINRRIFYCNAHICILKGIQGDVELNAWHVTYGHQQCDHIALCRMDTALCIRQTHYSEHHNYGVCFQCFIFDKFIHLHSSVNALC